MKKVVLIGAVVILGLASCKKEYTCECNQYNLETLEPITGTQENVTIKSSSKESAVEDCLAKGISESKACLIKQ